MLNRERIGDAGTLMSLLRACCLDAHGRQCFGKLVGASADGVYTGGRALLPLAGRLGPLERAHVISAGDDTHRRSAVVLCTWVQLRLVLTGNVAIGAVVTTCRWGVDPARRRLVGCKHWHEDNHAQDGSKNI